MLLVFVSIVFLVLFFVFEVLDVVDVFFFFSSRRRHTRFSRDWRDVCSSDLDTHAERRIEVAYARSGSAGSRLCAADLDADYLKSARLLHVTGITPALSPQ